MCTLTTTSVDGPMSITVGARTQMVDPAFCDALLNRVRERIRLFPPGELVTAEWILGVEVWAQLPRDGRFSGFIVSWLATEGLVKLERVYDVGCGSSNYYRVLP